MLWIFALIDESTDFPSMLGWIRSAVVMKIMMGKVLKTDFKNRRIKIINKEARYDTDKTSFGP